MERWWAEMEALGLFVMSRCEETSKIGEVKVVIRGGSVDWIEGWGGRARLSAG